MYFVSECVGSHKVVVSVLDGGEGEDADERHSRGDGCQ